MYSFFKSESGMIEPYNELPAMALAVIGFIVFIAIISQAYATYEDKSYVAGNYQYVPITAEYLEIGLSITIILK